MSVGRILAGSLLAMAATCLLPLASSRAQLPGTVDPAFAPAISTPGRAGLIATQADGKKLVVGAFHRVNSAVTQTIVRFNTDGSLDTGFVPPADLGTVDYVVVAPDGKMVVLREGDQPDSNYYAVLRLNANGSQDTSFAPLPLGNVARLGTPFPFLVAVQGDGKPLVAGLFETAPGSSLNTLKIVRVNTDGSLDGSFQLSGLNDISTPYSLLPLANGQLLVGGRLYLSNSSPLSETNILRFNADGSLDAAYLSTQTFFGAYALTPQPDGKVLFLRETNSNVGPGGVPRRSNADGSPDSTFSPSFDPQASFISLVLQPDGKVVVGGYVASTYVDSTVVGQSGVVRLNPDGTADATFQPLSPLVDTQITTLGLQTNGQLLVGGYFTTFGGSVRASLGLLNADGSVDPSFIDDLTYAGEAYAVAAQPGGQAIVLDSGSIVDGSKSSALFRLNTDGSLGTSFKLPAPILPYYNGPARQVPNTTLAVQADGKVLLGEVRYNQDGSYDPSFELAGYVQGPYAILPQPDGRILYAGGGYASYGEDEPALYPLFRVNADGSFDPAFKAAVDPGTNPYVATTFYALALQPDGRILAGGSPNTINNQYGAGVIRFNADGSVDPSFQAGAQTFPGGTIQGPATFALAVQADGKVIVGGSFGSIGGVEVDNLARLNVDGSLDVTFNASGVGTNDIVRVVVVQPDGKIIVGGDFTTIKGVALAGVARLNADGSVDPQFTPGTSTDKTGSIDSLALAADGSVIVGGSFTRFNGQPRDGLVRLFGGDIPPAPVITSSTTPTAQVGQAFTYQITASNRPTGFASSGLPDGLSLSATSGLISGTPTATGTFAVTVSATNLGGTGLAALTLTVNPATPVVRSGDAAQVQVGKAFNYQILAVNAPASYAATGLPAGLSVNAGTGAIVGTPTAAGTFSVALTATNAGGTGTGTLTLTVLTAPVVTFVIPGAPGSKTTTIVEGGQKLKVQVTRSGGDLTLPLTVRYKTGGDSVSGTDFKMLSDEVTIPAGAASAPIKVKIFDDGVADGTKALKLKLIPASDGSYTFGALPKIKITVLDLEGAQ